MIICDTQGATHAPIFPCKSPHIRRISFYDDLSIARRNACAGNTRGIACAIK